MKWILVLGALTALGLGAPQEEEAQDFSCQLVVTVDPAFFDHWYSTPEAHVITSSRVFPNQHFSVLPFLSGFQRDANGQASITFDLELFGPDGESEFRLEDMVAADENTGEQGPLLLAQDAPTLGWDEETAFGEHRIQVTAKDLLSGRTVSAEVPLELHEFEAGPALDGREGVQAWLYGFAENQDVERTLPALIEFARTLDSEEPEVERGFFRQLLEFNEWLFPELFAELEDCDADVRGEILWQLSRSNLDPSAVSERLEPADRERYEALWADSRNPQTDRITGRQDLNELWGSFVPYRHGAPIYRLVELLDVEKEGAVVDEMIQVEGTDLEAPLSWVVADVSAGILAAAIDWDERALTYARNMLSFGELAPDQRSRLQAVLDGE